MARARPNKLPLLIAAAGVFLVVLNMGPALLKPGDIDLYMLHLSWKGSRVELNPWNNSTGATIGDSPGTEHKKEEAAQEVKPADLSPAHIAIPDEISGCVDEALRRVKALGETLTGTAGPLVVGGIGDSGTRGAAELLMDFGCIMGDKHMTNSAHDSMYFHHDYSVRLPKYKKLRKRSYKDIAYPCITSAQSLIYGRTSLKSHFGAVSGDTKWFSGLQWISSMLSNHYSYYSKKFPAFQNESNPYHGEFYWGFKHPRTLIMLPFLEAVLKTNFKLVHVVRDGRDIALGDNRGMMNDLCKLILTGEEVAKGYCINDVNVRVIDDEFRRTTRNNLRFWARSNIEVISWARQHLEPHRYLVIRSEDLVQGKTECFERVQDFLYNKNDKRRLAFDQIQRIAQHYSKFNHSYNGNKYRKELRDEVTASVLGVPEAVEAMRLFGYSLDARMGTSNHCSDIPGV